jgi:hypothetical protein
LESPANAIDLGKIRCLNTNHRIIGENSKRSRNKNNKMEQPNTFKTLFCRLVSCYIFVIAYTSTAAQNERPIMKNFRDINLISNTAPQAQSKERLALVIGNSNYNNVSKLNNPQNDARDVADALRRVGFEVIQMQNIDHQGMVQAVATFSERLKHNKGVGLFYYAGHGIQVSGKNYLLPVDAKINKVSDIRFEAMNLDRVLQEMAAANNHLNIVVLDACRNNPFAGSFRQVSRGLAQINAPSGTLLAYATAPGDVAADGSDRNGIYTKHLLNHLEEPGLSIESLFKKVRQGVMNETAKRQVPWESSSLLGEFSFALLKKSNKPTVVTKGKVHQLCQLAKINQRPISCLFGGS